MSKIAAQALRLLVQKFVRSDCGIHVSLGAFIDVLLQQRIGDGGGESRIAMNDRDVYQARATAELHAYHNIQCLDQIITAVLFPACIDKPRIVIEMICVQNSFKHRAALKTLDNCLEKIQRAIIIQFGLLKFEYSFLLLHLYGCHRRIKHGCSKDIEPAGPQTKYEAKHDDPFALQKPM